MARITLTEFVAKNNSDLGAAFQELMEVIETVAQKIHAKVDRNGLL